MKLKATILAAIMAVSMSSHAQERATVGFRLGVQQWFDRYTCEEQSEGHNVDGCKSGVPVANPYVRLHIDGPHNLEMAGRFALADYRSDVTWSNSSGAYGTSQLRTGTKGLSLSYEHRPPVLDVAFRVGWHYTEIKINEAYRSLRSQFERDYTNEEKVNGFLVGVGFDLYRGTSLSVDWADWEEEGHVYSMLFGFEI